MEKLKLGDIIQTPENGEKFILKKGKFEESISLNPYTGEEEYKKRNGLYFESCWGGQFNFKDFLKEEKFEKIGNIEKNPELFYE
ncbi:MAG: hypothetical protein N4A38_03815 [Candidatus Gracilibacteria bacterium]|nr:hypothetical protein [Candidatus Gracilibacteria bacterium]